MKRTFKAFSVLFTAFMTNSISHALSKWLWPCGTGQQLSCGRGCRAIAIMAVYSSLALNSSSDKGIPDSIYEASLDSLSENEWHSSCRQEAWPCSLHRDVIAVLKDCCKTLQSRVWLTITTGQCQTTTPPPKPFLHTNMNSLPFSFKTFLSSLSPFSCYPTPPSYWSRSVREYFSHQRLWA